MTADGEDFPGVIELIQSLEVNKTLISLNLGNNKLEQPIGAAIRSMLDKNKTLIDLEVGFNNFTLSDVRFIKLTCIDSQNPRKTQGE